MSSSFCPATSNCLPRTAVIAWSVTRPARHARHEGHRTGACRTTAPFGPHDPGARLPRQICESTGCVDLFLDVWLHAHTAMHAKFGDPAAGDIDMALAYFHATARAQLQEIGRRGRAARGGVAKPQRNDGVIGRVARSFGDPWLADVFRFLLGYAASTGGEADGWPLDVLALRKSARDGVERPAGGTATRAELRADVAACLDGIRREAGDGWLYEYLLLPLANRGAVAPLPDDLEPAGPDGDPGDAALDDAAATMLDDLLRRVRSGASPQDALRSAVAAWFGDEPHPAHWARRSTDDLAVRRLAKALLADLTPELKAA
ncbi:hypothetical protein [Actinoplanes utahensis]|uniref:Uncharacterized protein n=1 Tax=Actinoplanes utahensis TaxID=1869 RepID=A0A0A6UHR2_ACTUT|nr:hypothetical protein [Actinoplanes utahensis]KHD75600.1 hypothetical protein MB27_21460 [Actinoplanes utahensis]GIF27111.1 hypothetical protein Aut01nite_00970 [Actinoplanes utahensis]